MGKLLFLVQVLLKNKTELVNYAYYENYATAMSIANNLKNDKLLEIDYIRVKEIKIS